MATNSAHVSAYPSRRARRLAQYLRAVAQRADGDLYVTPDAVAAEVELHPDDVHELLVSLRDTVPGLTLDPSSPTATSTWRVSTP